MTSPSGTVVTLADRRPILLVTNRDCYAADLGSGNIPCYQVFIPMKALGLLKSHPQRYRAVVLDIDHVKHAATWVTTWRLHLDCHVMPLAPPVILLWRGFNQQARNLANELGLPACLVPATGPMQLAEEIDKLLTHPARLSA